MQSEQIDRYDAATAQVDAELTQFHGPIKMLQVYSYIEALGKYDCATTFDDGFVLPSVRSRQQIIAMQLRLSEAAEVATESSRQFSPLPRTATAATDFNDRVDYVARKAQGVLQPSMNPGGAKRQNAAPAPAVRPAPPPMQDEILQMQRERFASGGSGAGNEDKPGQHRTLKEFAEMNPQRTRLLNGKLFTKELIYKTQRGGIPEALQ
jgi:hypothetical protein